MLSYLKWTAAAVALAMLAACSQNGTPQTITIQDVQNSIKNACNYVPSIESIVGVAATITTAINPAAGATATVLAATGNAITNEICKAVQAQTASMQKTKKGPGGTPLKEEPLDVVVNGVTVHGTLVPGEKT